MWLRLLGIRTLAVWWFLPSLITKVWWLRVNCHSRQGRVYPPKFTLLSRFSVSQDRAMAVEHMQCDGAEWWGSALGMIKCVALGCHSEHPPL